jgi:fibronectin-binding autotransporter adhesin
LTRTVGGTVNLVEAGNGGTAAITFTSRSSIATRSQLIPWATYGTAVGTATDFAMIDVNANGIDGFRRAADEDVNDVAAWAAGMDVSENGGSGYRGTLAASLALNSLHLDAAADSVITIAGGQTLRVASGGLMLATGVGASNKTITGGIFSPVGVYGAATTNSTTSVTVTSTASLAVGMPVSGTGIPAGATITAINVNGTEFTLSAAATASGTANLAIGELIVHHYGAGNLNLASQLGTQNGAPAVVTISGPAVTGAASLSNWNPSTTGQVVVSADNSNAGAITSETKWNLNGSVLSINNENQLGKVDITAATADGIYFNGGALRWTGNQYTALDNERGITIGGGGAVIDVVDGSANLQLTGDIVSENWLNYVQTGAANQYVGGDLIKMGAGTLTLTGGTDASQIGFTGGIDVREGTLRINGNNTGLVLAGTQTVSILGDNRSALDGTVFRNGTNFEVYFGAAGSAVEWRTEEWLRFEGNNTIRIGTPGATNRTTHLNGVIDLAGDVTVDVVPGLTARFNQSSGGYMTGTGDVTKVGQGILEFRDNNVLWSGGLNVLEGTMRLISTGLPGGVGTQAVTLGSTSHQGIADLQMFSENQIVGNVYELYQDINVTYNPLQTKRISFGADAAAGNDAWFHGDVTLSDNVGIYMLQGGRFQGGTYNNMYFTGDFKDDIANGRSGNIAVHVDDNNNGAANNQQVGEGVGYFVFRGNNSAWTGDLTIGINQSWDQDEISVVRLENALALTAVNDVTMNGSSKLQVAGNNVTIGSLISNNAAANGAVSTANDGLGNFQGTTGSSAWIENAGTAPGKITITQTTPVNTEALWDVHFQDGQLPSHVLDNPQLTGASLSVVKAGNGWATMTLDNDYTGTTEITGGILQVGKNGIGDTGAPRLATAPGLTATAGGILAGTGVVQGATVIGSGATLKPGDVGGDGIGTLTLNGNASLAVGSITSLQVKGASYNNTNYLGYLDPAYGGWLTSIPSDTYSTALTDPLLSTQHDKVNVSGSLTWTVGSTINVINNGYTPNAGDIFNLFDWFTISGAVNVGSNIRTGAEAGTDLNLFTLGGDYRWDTSLFNSNGLLVVVAPGLIPEPGRMMLLLFGLLGIFLRRRRQHSQA